MNEIETIIQEKKDEMRLLKIVDDILQEGNRNYVKPEILEWYDKTKD